jgi:hypothetical protein
MKHSPFLMGHSSSVTIPTFHTPKRTGFLARLLDALHHSRRLQAQNRLRTHRHLLARSWNGNEQSMTAGGDNVDR